MDSGDMFYGLRESCCQVERAKVTLKNSELWRKFHELDTEMIITKNGRRMFPSLQVDVSRLDPAAHYCLLLELEPAARCRYKYSTSGGWAPAGAEEAQSPQRVYMHPDSPATGEYWMSQPVSFGRLKLTNSPSPPAGHLVLSSMHRYRPRVVVARTSDPRAVAWAPSSSASFDEAQFVAVTAYQNERITRLKIDHNPFAKGFRENGQSKRKRKEAIEGKTRHDDDEERDDDEGPSAAKLAKTEATSPGREYPASPCSTVAAPNSPPHPCVYVPAAPYYDHHQPYYSSTYPVYGSGAFFALYAPPCYYPLPSPAVAEDLSPPKKEEARKFTDFSIRAITGYT